MYFAIVKVLKVKTSITIVNLCIVYLHIAEEKNEMQLQNISVANAIV